MKLAGIAILAVALAGCAASATMKEYVGQPLMQPVLKNGPPAASYDMGDGTRAFMWTQGRSYTAPATAMTTGNATAYGGYGMANVYGTATTTYYPGSTSTWKCNYVLFAKHTNKSIEGPAGWTVVDYQKPDWTCE